VFKLNNLRSPAGSNHKPLRKGKGIGSGHGKTAGKGHKGQRARSGGFTGRGRAAEGGQVPAERRLPKVGFRSQLKFLRVAVNLSSLGRFSGTEVSAAQLVPKAYGSHPRLFIAIIGTKMPSTLPKSVEAHKVSPKAKELLEAAGCKVSIREHKDGHPGVRPAKKATTKTTTAKA